MPTGPGAGINASPKPHKVYAQVAPIPVTPLEKELKFPALSIEFSESAARLDDLQKPTLDHVRLDPAMTGAWKWINDRKLVFEPAQDWPADRKFRIIFDKDVFPTHVLMDRLRIRSVHAAIPCGNQKRHFFRGRQRAGGPARHRHR